ncbi:MAG: hypothetical protein ACK5WZ_11265 [Pseudobdellovibrionaceae bacterium]
MPTRTKDWDESLSKKLKNLSYAQKFVVALIDEGDDLQVALGRFVRLYGVKEYAAILEIEESALQRAVNPEHNPTKETLEKIVAPLNLSLALKPKDAA